MKLKARKLIAKIILSIVRPIWIFLKLLYSIYCTIFRRKSFCHKKLASWTLGHIKLDDCRYHVCQYQAMNKLSKQCPCGRIKNELLEF